VAHRRASLGEGRFDDFETAFRLEVAVAGAEDRAIRGGGGGATFMMAAQSSEWFDAEGNYTGGSLLQANQLELFDSRSMEHGAGLDNTMLLLDGAQDFEFTVVNFGDSNLTGLIALQLTVGSDLSLYAQRFSEITPPIDIPAIPEPSTYALMGLGLVGIATVARRRRHTA